MHTYIHTHTRARARALERAHMHVHKDKESNNLTVGPSVNSIMDSSPSSMTDTIQRPSSPSVTHVSLLLQYSGHYPSGTHQSLHCYNTRALLSVCNTSRYYYNNQAFLFLCNIHHGMVTIHKPSSSSVTYTMVLIQYTGPPLPL